uniref:Uncharacterized protein n=1 Tax=Anguilla anguilla TaxID=7936 RepID=A0A0E9WVP3_ANGAN
MVVTGGHCRCFFMLQLYKRTPPAHYQRSWMRLKWRWKENAGASLLSLK